VGWVTCTAAGDSAVVIGLIDPGKVVGSPNEAGDAGMAGIRILNPFAPIPVGEAGDTDGDLLDVGDFGDRGVDTFATGPQGMGPLPPHSFGSCNLGDGRTTFATTGCCIAGCQAGE